ncbi:MAG: DUF3109 family protein [Tannerella sp.]|jgi:hypothetical protein|nr:DUF3109 family protein [Tannerella sp.]
MIRIEDTLVSLDLVESYFRCDLTQCKGACCIEGDAGAPLEQKEFDLIRKLLPLIWDDLSPAAQTVINHQGVGYIDRDGEIVTSIVDGKDCVFTCYDSSGVCSCAIEKAYRAGLTDFIKPVSCHLYPVRITQCRDYKAVNYSRWNICRAAETAGRLSGTPLYRFLREPLVRKFGEEWYGAIDACARDYLKIKY